jgi:hypothetical protein
MICPNPVLKVYVTEKISTLFVVAAHRHPRSPHQGITSGKIGNDFFNSLLEGMALTYAMAKATLPMFREWQTKAAAEAPENG